MAGTHPLASRLPTTACAHRPKSRECTHNEAQLPPPSPTPRLRCRPCCGAKRDKRHNTTLACVRAAPLRATNGFVPATIESRRVVAEEAPPASRAALSYLRTHQASAAVKAKRWATTNTYDHTTNLARRTDKNIANHKKRTNAPHHASHHSTLPCTYYAIIHTVKKKKIPSNAQVSYQRASCGVGVGVGALRPLPPPLPCRCLLTLSGYRPFRVSVLLAWGGSCSLPARPSPWRGLAGHCQTYRHHPTCPRAHRRCHRQHHHLFLWIFFLFMFYFIRQVI